MAFLELRYYWMRNSRSNQIERTNTFLAEALVPGLRRAGGGPTGVFAPVIGPGSPYALVVTSYPSLAAMQTVLENLAADPVYKQAYDAWNAIPDLSYIRMESTLLRCFSGFPAIETGAPRTNPRLFELRTYESDNEATLRKKISMFEDGEIAVFRTCGLQPVFFSEAIVGSKLPQLTYMLAYEDMADRERAWNTFRTHPDWIALRDQPGLSDPDIVSNISSSLVRPGAGSEIR